MISYLLQVAVPHATLFGASVAYGEVVIGFGTLLGLLKCWVQAEKELVTIL